MKPIAPRSVGEFRKKFVVEERYLPGPGRRGLYWTAAVLILVGLAVFAVLVIGVTTHTGFERLDVPVERWFDSLRSRDVTSFMLVLAVLFGPVGMPIIVLIVAVTWLLFAGTRGGLCFWLRVWRPG